MAPAAVLSANRGRGGGAPPDSAPIVRASSSAPTPAAGIAAPQSIPAPDRWSSASSAALGLSGSGSAPGCDAHSIVAERALTGGTDCVAPDLERDQAFVVETASPGGTMLRQGSALAVTRLHPVFVRRLADAIREARDAGLPSAGIFSAYRPPAFGVGGFADKFNSLHSYGLAVDMLGIGGPGSSEAKLWHEIAARHGIVCPYGADNRREWNHCQPTRVKIIPASDPLRGTVSPQGPVDLEVMFAVGDALVSGDGAGSPEQQPASDQVGIGRARPQPHPQGSAGRSKPITTGHDKADRAHERHTPLKPIAGVVASRHLHEADGHPNLRIMREISARDNRQTAPSRCRHLHNHRRGVCGVLAENAFGKSRSVRKYRTSSLVRREFRVR
jgi:hypothetical protein